MEEGLLLSTLFVIGSDARNTTSGLATPSIASQFHAGDSLNGKKLTAAASIGVAVLTRQAAFLLRDCLSPLLACRPMPRVLVVDSSSTDGTAELARRMGADVLSIRRDEFNHGVTRELARRTLGTDIVIMMTQDARPLGPELVGNLINPILQGKASVAYARQLPRDCAGFFEAFPRHFNYGETDEIRSIEDIGRLGAYTFFCSNSCAAWSNSVLDSIGGFAPTKALEDTIATAKLLHLGHKIAYCADALVVHSHPFTLVEEFKRQFDTGCVRALHKKLLFSGGGDERRGATYAVEMLRQLVGSQPYLVPYAIAHITLKYLGYRLGFHSHALPMLLKSLS